MSRQSGKELPFNDRAVRTATHQRGRATEYRIKGVRGLVLYVYGSDRKVFHVHYDIVQRGVRRRRKPRIGDYGEITLHAARARANAMMGMVDAGNDPETERLAAEALVERTRFTFADLVDDFLEDRRRRGVRSLVEIERVLRKDAIPLLGRLRACDVTDLTIQAVVDQVVGRGAQALASRVLIHLRAVFNYARKNALWRHRGISSNPADDIDRPHKPVARVRALNNEEIASFLSALNDAPMDTLTRIAITLILVTGQRPNEVSGMRIDELRLSGDNPQWRLPQERTKNGRAHLLPLSPLALRLINGALMFERTATSPARPNSPFVFPNRDRPEEAPYTKGALSRALRRTLSAGVLSIDHFTLHDLRRTAATGLARLGTDRVVISKILNHVSEDNRSVTGLVYDQHDYGAEKRLALEKWAAHLGKLAPRSLDGPTQGCSEFA
jgi:integrase